MLSWALTNLATSAAMPARQNASTSAVKGASMADGCLAE